MKWKIRQESYHRGERWTVTDGIRSFECRSKEDAEWLLEYLIYGRVDEIVRRMSQHELLVEIAKKLGLD